MNEHIDLTKILKNCPKGWKLYTPIFGEVEFSSIEEGSSYPIMLSSQLRGIKSFSKEGFYYTEYTDVECLLFPSKNQRDWNKFTAHWYKKENFVQNIVKPKFKVGDRVRHKETNKGDVYEISEVYEDSYGIAGAIWRINIEYQDQYELVSNKFDPKTLKAFDKVITRNEGYEWACTLFSHINNESDTCFIYVTCESVYKYCIPYNEDTKYLVGTKKEAPEYYKYWED